MPTIALPIVTIHFGGGSPEAENTNPLPKRAALKEEYAPAEWSAWAETQSHVKNASCTEDQVDDSFTKVVPSDPIVDVIAVQGLASTYERTWNKQIEDGKSIMWLRDLLPKDVPRARILTFEYDSKWLDDPANVTLRDCADQLLQSILWDRTHRGEEEMCKRMARRPIILIGHSFGGLVIKRALVRAAACLRSHPQYEELQSIARSVAGVIYLGTPHHGSQLAQYGMLQSKIYSMMGRTTIPSLLKPLLLDDRTNELEYLEEDFQGILQEASLTNVEVFYFWETKPVKIGSWEIVSVVDKSSATRGGLPEKCVFLESNHKDMNKFGHRDESNYRKVMKCINFISGRSREIVGRRWGRDYYDGKFPGPKLKSIKDWLKPADITARHHMLQSERYEGTCLWATEHDLIERWLNPASDWPLDTTELITSCLWIHGKPGSGKSVLSSFLYDWLQDLVGTHNRNSLGGMRCSGLGDSAPCKKKVRSQILTVLYFPFTSGQKLKSAVLTLVHQLLKQHPDDLELQDLVDSAMARSEQPISTTAMDLLIELVEKLPLTYVLIDGLDEWDPRDDDTDQNFGAATSRAMFLLHRLCRVKSVRLLILSRRDLLLEKSIMNEMCMDNSVVDITLHNKVDINLFIRKKTLDLARQGLALEKLQNVIQVTIQEHSKGMFQWVKLVITALEYHGESEKTILNTLHHFPQDLDGAYQKTFDRLSSSPGYNKPRAVLALKWLTCGERPMTLRELYTALELYEGLKYSSVPGTESVDVILEDVAKISEDVIRKEFTLLLGPLAEFHRSQRIVAVVDASGNIHEYDTTIHICHHSLTQLLVTRARNLPRMPEVGNSLTDFRFSLEAAHALAASTCMKMMAAPGALETVTEHFYTPDRDLHLPPFLGYASEQWSHHIKASGIRPDKDNDMVDTTKAVIQINLELSLHVLGALAYSFQRIDASKVLQMMQAIAIRDSQSAILPAISTVQMIIPNLQDLANGLRNIHIELTARGQLKPGTWNTAITDREEEETKITGTLDSNLDSSIMQDVFCLAEADPILFAPIMDHLRLLRDTSRKLRGLTVRLTAEPVRSLLYRCMGEHGLNPIITLAQATHALDILLASSLQAPVTTGRSGFRDQFATEAANPLFGLVTCTRQELDEKGSSTLSATFYKEHILGHYALRQIEWRAIALTTFILEYSPNYNTFTINGLIRQWHATSVKVSYDEAADTNQTSSSLFTRRKTKTSADAPTWTSYLLYLPQIAIVIAAKIFSLVFPAIEQLFINVYIQITLKGRTILPWLAYLFAEWRYSSVSIIVYLLRLQYLPWLFASPRNTPWKDLMGMYNEPFTYKTNFQKASWMKFTLLFFQEMVVLFMVSWDNIKIAQAAADAQGQPQDQERQNPLIRRLKRSISFKFDPFEDSLVERLAVIEQTIRPHILEVLTAAFRFILVERTLFEISYIIFDLLQISVQLLNPNSWSLSLFVQASSGLIGHVIGTLLVASIGAVSTCLLFFSLWIGSKVWNWLRLTLLLKLLFRISLYPVLSFFWGLLEPAYRLIHLTLATIVAHILRTASELAGALGPFGTVVSVSCLITAFSLLFLVVMLDPLNLRRAASECAAASELAARLNGTDRPLELVRWKASDRMLIKDDDFVDLDQIEKLGETETLS